jgi:hypothetical protein
MELSRLLLGSGNGGVPACAAWLLLGMLPGCNPAFALRRFHRLVFSSPHACSLTPLSHFQGQYGYQAAQQQVRRSSVNCWGRTCGGGRSVGVVGRFQRTQHTFDSPKDLLHLHAETTQTGGAAGGYSGQAAYGTQVQTATGYGTQQQAGYGSSYAAQPQVASSCVPLSQGGGQLVAVHGRPCTLTRPGHYSHCWGKQSPRAGNASWGLVGWQLHATTAWAGVAACTG